MPIRKSILSSFEYEEDLNWKLTPSFLFTIIIKYHTILIISDLKYKSKQMNSSNMENDDQPSL